MSNLEHAIENALVCIESGKSFKEFAEKENDLGNLNGISATAEEIWRIAEYVKYTYCNACEFMEVTMPEKLKPCPFCGGEVELDFVGEEFYMVRCDKCASATSFAKELEDGTAEDSTKAETIEAWNRRADNEV